MPATRRRFLALSASLPAVALLASAARARTPEIYADDGVAIDGTDAVAYFTEGKPVAGSADFSHEK